MSPSVAQIFLYDTVNRLMLASEKPSNSTTPVCPDTGSQWCEQFSYDPNGNRSMLQSSSTGLVSPVNFSSATNRITDSGWGYDQAGNLNQDLAGLFTSKHDSENRLVAVCASDGPSTCTNQAAAGRTLYSYDGGGRRVTKQLANGTMTTFVYDALGQLAAEYGSVSSQTTEYLTADQLGSTRVVTDAGVRDTNGNVTTAGKAISRHDFRPFGDEIGANARPSGIGYGADGSVRQEFTSKERDAETGLDFFSAR